MNSLDIEKAIQSDKLSQKPVTIYFKQRNGIAVHFIKAPDYQELKAKNFWRVVNPENLQEWKKTGNVHLTRLFNGNEFSKLR